MAARAADAAHGRTASRSRPGSGRWLDPAWRTSVEAWVAGRAGAARPADRRARSSSRTSGRGRRRCASRPTAGPSGSRRPDPAPRTRARCWRSSRGLAPSARSCRWPSTRPGRGSSSTTPGRRSARPRPDGRGDHDLAAWERILAEYAALQRSVEGEAAVAGDAGRGHARRAAGAPGRGAGPARGRRSDLGPGRRPGTGRRRGRARSRLGGPARR